MKEPIKPTKPVHPGIFNLAEPQKKFYKTIDILDFIKENFSHNEFTNKNDFVNFLKEKLTLISIPDNATDISLLHHNAYYDSDEEFYFSFSSKNENYDEELKIYNAELKIHKEKIASYNKEEKKYKKAIDLYNQEMEEYKNWLLNNEKRIKQAESAVNNLKDYMEKNKGNLDQDVIKNLISLI